MTKDGETTESGEPAFLIYRELPHQNTRQAATQIKKTKPTNYSANFHFVSAMFWSSRKWRHIDAAISAVFTLSFSTSTSPILSYDALPSHLHSELINSPRGVAFACFDLIMAWQIVGILHIYTWEAEVQGTTGQLSAVRNENTRQERQIISFYCIEEEINVKLT